MMSRRMIRVVAGGIFLLFCMTAVVYRNTYKADFTQESNVLSYSLSGETPNIKRKELTRLQKLNAAQFDNQSDVKCATAKLGNLSFQMCLYDPKIDNVVSKMILNGQYYESDLVLKLLKLFRLHNDMTFVDLGANLGTYSLPIAHSGMHVVSVEPNKDTVRRLAKSVYLGGIEKNVDLLHYALSNEESTTYLKFQAVNRGNTFMADNGSCPGCMSVEVTVLNNLIPFLRHRKVFMKVDVQEAEIMIFQRKCAARFFEEFDVIMIQMEWHLYPKRFSTTEDGRRRVDRFLEFFYQRGYDVYDPRSEKKLGASWTKWTFDVLFKKEDLPKNELLVI